MTSSLELYMQAFEKVVETVKARRQSHVQNFYDLAARGDGWLTQHEQGLLDGYEEAEGLLDSVQYELTEMLDQGKQQ